MFILLIVVIKRCVPIKMYQIVYFKYVNYTSRKLYKMKKMHAYVSK